MTDEEATSRMRAEMGKPAERRDRPLLAKLFRQTFVTRRSSITAVGDGQVEKLIEDFPLLSDIYFVSS